MTEVDFTDRPNEVTREFGFRATGYVELCYQFFNEGVVATGVKVMVKEVTRTAPQVIPKNVASNVAFIGTGIANGDLAKWVLSDRACEEEGFEATVESAQAMYTIAMGTEGDAYYKLCYEFARRRAR